MNIEDKKTVKISYIGKFENNEVFDKGEIEFIVGNQMIIPGLEKNLIGLKQGEKKQNIKVTPSEGYGEYNEKAIEEIPKTQLPKEIEIKVGLVLMTQTPQGQMPVTIKEIKDETLIMDFNSPLAGKTLIFDIEVLEVSEKELSENKCCGSGECHKDKENKKCCEN